MGLHGHGGTVAFHGRNGGRPGLVSHEFGWYSWGYNHVHLEDVMDVRCDFEN